MVIDGAIISKILGLKVIYDIANYKYVLSEKAFSL